MNKAATFIFKVSKGIYDILATYLLFWVLYVALISLGLHALFSLLAQALDYPSAELMWRTISWKLKVDISWVQFLIYGSAQLAILWQLRPLLKNGLSTGERFFDSVIKVYQKLGARAPKLKAVLNTGFSLIVTLLLIPFVIQPTLVGMRVDKESMWERSVNLLDGEATLGFADSVIGFYRKLYADPVKPVGGVPRGELDRIIAEDDSQWNGTSGTLPPKDGAAYPLMDRWDPYIQKAANNDPNRFAYIKAFMWVESAGRQFAVSHTGCAGLMQFCGGTARRQPFVNVFGRGQVYKCQCNGPCRISKEIRKDMERGDENIIKQRKDHFPCDLTDARFDGAKSIRAGALYIDSLYNKFGGNIYLMYIGYNSGPAVASKVYEKLGRNPYATIEDIDVHLADVMTRWYGSSAPARARSLTRTHLPKIKKAYDRYYVPTSQLPVAMNDQGQ